MNLVRWNPWVEMETIHHRLNELFEGHGLGLDREDSESRPVYWSPTVDVLDKENMIVINAELPGVEKKNVSVNLEKGILTLMGVRNNGSEAENKHYYRRERFFGKFHRAFKLPDTLDSEKIRADFKDGILTIEIPKAEKAKPKQITVH